MTVASGPLPPVQANRHYDSLQWQLLMLQARSGLADRFLRFCAGFIGNTQIRGSLRHVTHRAKLRIYDSKPNSWN
jgi:hypothetical protein